MIEEAKVYVVDDDQDVRDSLCVLIQSIGLPVVPYSSAEAFLEACDPANGGTTHRAGCLVLDIRMPGISGLELQEELGRRRITLPIIFITAHGEVPAAVRALQNGAFDFLEKPFSHQKLLERVRKAIEHDLRARNENARLDEVVQRLETLTPRESQVLDLVVEGKPTKIIAEELGISAKTVDAHRANILRKMRARSLADLIRLRLSCELRPV